MTPYGFDLSEIHIYLWFVAEWTSRLTHNDTYARIIVVLELAATGSGPRRPSTDSWTCVLYITSIALD